MPLALAAQSGPEVGVRQGTAVGLIGFARLRASTFGPAHPD